MKAFEGARDDLLLAALLSGETLKAAAETAKMSESTARRRLGDPAFKARLDEDRAQIVSAVVARLAAGAEHAVTTLLALLDEPTPAQVRRNAARDVLSLAAEFGEATDLDRRLAALEELLAQRMGRVA